MSNRLRLVFFLVILLFALVSNAQTSSISLVHYTTDHGLSHDEVNAIIKDKDGFMWFGTNGGLNRFDGRHFKIYIYEPGKPNSLPNNEILGITEDADGTLWLATAAGLCRFDKTQQRFQLIDLPEYHDNIEGNERVSRMAIDRKGNGWFSSINHLVKINLKTLDIQRFSLPHKQPDRGHVLIDKKGRIWINVDVALYRFDEATGAFLYMFGHIRGQKLDVDIGMIYQEDDGTLWCGSWGSGWYRYNEQKGIFEDYPDQLGIAIDFLADWDQEGKKFYWVAGGLDGLFLYYPEEAQIYRMSPNPRESYSHNGSAVADLYKDKASGIVWIATRGGGIEKYDPKAIKFQRGLIPLKTNFSQFSMVSKVLRDRLDPEGERYWVGVWGTGLYEWNRRDNTFYNIDEHNGLISNEIFDMVQDVQGTLYIATAGGVNIYNPNTGKFQYLKGFMNYPHVSQKVLSVMMDHAGKLWIGANYDGIFCYDPAKHSLKKVLFYDTTQFKTVGYIRAIQEDNQHRLWIATHSGVFRLNPTTGEWRYFNSNGLPNRYRSDGLYLGRNGNVWIATTQGLVQMDTSGKVLYRYTKKDELQSEHIFGVIEDAQGMVWMQTTNMLYRLNPITKRIDHFDKRDGLFGNSMTDGFNMTDEGEIFIGFQNAFNYFQPEKLVFNTDPPSVKITAVKVLNREHEFKPGEPIVLQPRENVLSIEFAALNFSQSEKNRYEYFLEGFDQTWQAADQPIVTYTNLNGGEYTLWVKAANNDRVWSKPIKLTALKVIPPFRKTWYFAALLAFIAAGIVVSILVYQQQQERRVAIIRERIARDLHDDMGSALSSIRFFSEFARSKVANPEVSPILQRISESAATLSESMQDIIWAINTKNDQLDDLVTRMRQFGLKILEARGIDFKVHVSEGFRPTRLNIGQRRNIYLIFKEAINNAAKYADCNHVELHIDLTANQLRVIIEDNGKGFNEQEVERGNGLNNMRKRAAEIGGTLDVKSQNAKGTMIELKVRI
ncbi:MAG: two-component regulator propeller domain-containing protein [Saprospiraceae bacterium]|nr:two-component regulator propeller domain-containing protein [Saprospiraceae bacterium]